MFFSFDYVLKEMVKAAAVQPSSYGCIWRFARVALGYRLEQLLRFFLTDNLPRAP